MQKEYSILLGRFIELKDIIELWHKELCRFKDSCLIIEKSESQRSNKNDYKTLFENKVRQIEDTIYSFQKQGKSYPFLKFLKTYELDPIERILIYYVIGLRICEQEVDHCQSLFHLLSNNDSSKFVELNLMYFNSDAKLFREKIFIQHRPIGFFISENLFREICELKIEKKKKEIHLNYLPKDIYHELSRKVIGQEEAKRALSTAVFQQYQKVSTKNTIKNNVLLIGPTGTGKTYLARTLAEYLNVPIVFCSANEFTETGYVGRDVTEIVADLVKKADNNIEKAEKGIVFIDEIDKIATYNSIYAHFNNRDVSGRSVQEELLDLLEGSGKRCFSKNRWFSSNIYFNISKVLFIAAGAFDGLRELIEKRQKPSIGFYSENNNRNDSANTMSIEISDLIEYGLIPELIGRFPVIVQCNPLEKSDLLKILLESEDSVLKKYQKFFKEYGTELEFSNDFLESVVEISLLRKTGARGLASVLENILRPYLFDLTNPAKRKNHIIFENYSFPSVQENKVTIQEETKQ